MENAVSNVEEIQTLMFQPSQKKKSTENNEQVPPSQEQTTPNPHDELLAISARLIERWNAPATNSGSKPPYDISMSKV